jgi:mannitol-1-/sugar-/sorbitol-6-phosphatase
LVNIDSSLGGTLILEADAFLFDLDGTLINSLAVVDRVWSAWAVENGLNTEEVVAACHGRRSIDTIRRFAPHLPLPEANNDFVDRESADVEGLLEIPGAISFLKSLPWDRWAIVTSCPKKLAAVRMTALGVPAPKVIVKAEDVSEGKPNPEGFLLAARKLGMEPHRCVVFEDAAAGIEAGRRAGMQVVTVTATHTGAVPSEISIVDYRSLKLLSQEPLVLEI